MTEAKIFASDNISVSIHHIDDLKQDFPQWDMLSRREKMRLSRSIKPVHSERTSNTTCVGLNEYIVDNLDKDQSVNEDAIWLAVGDDNTSPSTSNTNLNSEIGRFEVTSTTDSGSSLDTSTFIDSNQGNDNTFREVGLVNQQPTSGDILFNHSTISDIVKTSEKTATIDITLTFSSV